MYQPLSSDPDRSNVGPSMLFLFCVFRTNGPMPAGRFYHPLIGQFVYIKRD
jgi:hypothetical protein